MKMTKRLALLIGNSIFDHTADFPNLRTPGNDARDFGRVLQEYGDFEILDTPLNAPAETIRQAIDELFSRAERGDLILIYYSGHGYRDRYGRHYLIAKDSRSDRLQSTAVAESFIHEAMSASRSRHQAIILDCCFSGAFIEGKKGGEESLLLEKLKGEATAILASSGKIQYSFEEKGRNSLFTRYLLQGIETGEAAEGKDGVVWIDDLFYYADPRVRDARPEQTPMIEMRSRESKIVIARSLKVAGLQENEFVLQTGEQPQRNPDLEPAIENPKQIPLPDGAEFILKTMFNDYQQVFIVSELGGGFSGSQIFIVRPIVDETSAELRTVVKLASVSLIEKELKAYRTCIRHRLPDAAQIQGEAVLPSNSEWGGVRYALQGGGGTFEIESLYAYLRHAEIEDIRRVFERLFKRMERIWQQSKTGFEFHFHANYERYLPVNLFIQISDIPNGQPSHLLSPGNLNGESLRREDYVRLAGFVVSKVDLNYGTMDLNLPRPDSGSLASFSIRLKWADSMPAYQVGQVIEPIEGTIIETRQERLETEARRALGRTFDLSNETISWPSGPSLPNPLFAWSSILSECRDVRTACIHGDLNLENILVNLENHDVSLIDFADARRDHVLHDFLRLETEVVAKIIPEILNEHNLPSQTICAFYQQLHLVIAHPGQVANLSNPALEKPWAMLLAIRTAAGNYLFKRDDWTEYYQGLAIYLLGALKFGNLDKMGEVTSPLPKQAIFWGASVVVELVENLPALFLPATEQKSTEFAEGHKRKIQEPQPFDIAQDKPRAKTRNSTMTSDFTSTAADFVIVTALEEERDAVLGKLPGFQKSMPSDDDIRIYYSTDLPVTFPDGSTGNYRAVVMPLLGMGRVEATAATNDAIRRWNPRYVIMVGIAGGVAAAGVRLGDVIVSDQVADYEQQKVSSRRDPDIRWKVYPTNPRLIGAARNLLNPEWQPLIEVERPGPGKPKHHIGPIASGDKVIAAQEALAQYRDTWSKLIGVEMEAGGVAISALQAASQPKFFMIRGVSDLADEDKGSASVEQWRLYACDVAAAYAVGLLRSGPVTLGSARSMLKKVVGDAEEERASQREKLRVHYKNLRRLKLQEAKFGSLNVPIYILNQIDEEKAEIARLEDLLGLDNK